MHCTGLHNGHWLIAFVRPVAVCPLSKSALELSSIHEGCSLSHMLLASCSSNAVRQNAQLRKQDMLSQGTPVLLMFSRAVCMR